MNFDVPPGYGSTKKYNGTLGHKANHNFDATVKFSSMETARYYFVAYFLFRIIYPSKASVNINVHWVVEFLTQLGKNSYS